MTGPAGLSVLMSVYARESPEALDAALTSLEAQTCAPEEVVLVKDGPLGAELEAVLEAHRESLPMRLVALPRNVGLTAALNAGLREVTQPWVLRFDSDDICMPHRIEAQLARIERGDADVFGAQIAEFETDPPMPTRSRQVPCSHEEIRRFAMRRNPFNHMTVCYRKSLVDAVGGYPGILWMEDYALWLRLLAAGARTANSPEVLVLARVGNGMVARRGGWRYVRSEWQLQALMRSLGLKPAWRAILDGTLRSAAFLLPVAARERVYRHLLRRGATAPAAARTGSGS